MLWSLKKFAILFELNWRLYCSQKWFLNYLVDVHGHSFRNNTKEALRFTKDSILRYPSLLGIPVGTEIVRPVKNARQRYKIDLDKKRKETQKEDVIKKVVEEKEDEGRRTDLIKN